MSDSTYEDFNNNPRKQGASTATKIVLTLACVFGLVCVACCGGVFYMGNKLVSSFSDDPVKAREVAAKILDVKVPDSLPPKGSMDLVIAGAGVRMVIFTDQKDGAPGGGSMLMITEVAGAQDQAQPGIPNAGGAPGFDKPEAQPFVESVVQKMTINGKETSFEIGKIKQGDQEHVQATGPFTTKGGNIGNLILVAQPSAMDQDAAVEFIRSLGTPIGEPEVKVKAAPVETPDASDAPEKAADANEKASDAPEKTNESPDKSNDSNS